MSSDLPLSPISPDELYCDEAMPATEVMKIPVRYPYQKTYCGIELVYESDNEDLDAPPKCEPCYQLSSYSLAENAEEFGIENRSPQILRTPMASAGPSRAEAATLEQIEKDIWQPNDHQVVVYTTSRFLLSTLWHPRQRGNQRFYGDPTLQW